MPKHLFFSKIRGTLIDHFKCMMPGSEDFLFHIKSCAISTPWTGKQRFQDNMSHRLVLRYICMECQMCQTGLIGSFVIVEIRIQAYYTPAKYTPAGYASTYRYTRGAVAQLVKTFACSVSFGVASTNTLWQPLSLRRHYQCPVLASVCCPGLQTSM